MGRNGKRLNSVIVAGAGVTGIHAALALADIGFKVYVVDEQANIGGKMVQLYRTAEDNFVLGMITPVLLQAVNNPNIEIMPLARLKDVEGEPGEFTVSLERTPRYVDPLKCVTCGQCWRVCPVQTDSEFDYGMGSRKAIYMPYAGVVPNKPSIDPDTCLHLKGKECTKCADVCPTGAISFEAREIIQKLKVGAVILTPGIEPFRESEEAKKLGYGKIPDVIDNFQMDRLVSIYGPSQGQIKRPSDNNKAKRIAFIQCVGSRKQENDLPYCSSVCCMHAIRSALSALNKDDEYKVTIFHNDIMALSKLHEKVYAEARKRGVNFIRARISSVLQEQGSAGIKVEYVTEEGDNPDQATFDLAVLALGLVPSGSGVALAKKLGIPLNEWHFPETPDYSHLTLPGIAVAGSFRSLSDTPEAVADAQAAAMEVAEILSGAGAEEKPRESLPPEISMTGLPPRVGVYICECGGIISEVLDTKELARFAGNLDGVMETKTVDYACYKEGAEQIQKSIKEKDINRVVFVGCSYRSHLPKIQNLIRRVGLNKFLVEMVNARELCAWVNKDEKDLAMERMKDELRGTVAKVKGLEPMPVYIREVRQKCLVVGGGVSGMIAAQSVASHGIPVDIVEKSDHLGGNADSLSYDAKGRVITEYLDTLKKEIDKNPLIKVLSNSEIREVKGRIGQFSVRIHSRSGDLGYNFGAIIVATGGKEYKPHEYLYGRHEKVITQLELERMIRDNKPELKKLDSAVIVHCVGSRTDGRPFCSKVCCTQALKNSLKLKQINPDINIHHVHRDIRTYFLNDMLYRRAEKEGVNFTRYDEEKGIDVSHDGGLAARFLDSRNQEEVELRPGLLVLNTALLPGEDSQALSRLLGVPLGKYGFFKEEDYMTFTPVDFSKKGIFLCGLAQGPKTIDEGIVQAKAAAIRALSILSKDRITHQGVVAQVEAGKCIACLTCVRVCPFGVPFISENQIAEIVPAECRGCGVCVSSCPNDAIELKSFTDKDVIPQIKEMIAL